MCANAVGGGRKDEGAPSFVRGVKLLWDFVSRPIWFWIEWIDFRWYLWECAWFTEAAPRADQQESEDEGENVGETSDAEAEGDAEEAEV